MWGEGCDEECGEGRGLSLTLTLTSGVAGWGGAGADRGGLQRGAELCARATEQRRDDEEGHHG